MKIVPDSTLMRIYIAEGERTKGKATYRAIVEALQARGIRGAIVFKGIEGYGSHRHITSSRTVDAYVNLPILIEAIDEHARIAAFLPELDDLLADGLVTLERLHAARFRSPGGED